MEELKNKLIAICNESDLPLEAVYFVTKDLWRDVDVTLRSMKEKEKSIAKEIDKNEEELKE